jgi:hypothetical protein
MFRIVLIVAVVLLAAGGGAAGWWFGVRGEPFPFASAQAADGNEAAGTNEVEFVELDPLTFPVMRDGQVRDLITYVISIEVPDGAAEAALRRRAPVVRDRMLRELHGLYALRFMDDRDGRTDLVKLRLLKAARAVAGTDLNGVYLQTINKRAQQARRTDD